MLAPTRIGNRCFSSSEDSISLMPAPNVRVWIGGHTEILLSRASGHVVGHPELTIVGLSEEVAKVKADGTCTLQVGDRVRNHPEIIPAPPQIIPAGMPACAAMRL